LLPCGYFHLVFTLPHALNPIILCNKVVTLNLLFAAVKETLHQRSPMASAGPARHDCCSAYMVSDPY
jgi:hypothetical protein